VNTAAHAHAEHPPEAHRSSRVDARLLGIYFFIASEVMLFGSFFSAYFFARVVAGAGEPWPPEGLELPVYLALLNTVILVTSSFTMHWALQSIKRNNRTGLVAGLTLTFLLGLTFLLIQAREYTRIGFSPADNAFASTFNPIRGRYGFCGSRLGYSTASYLANRPLPAGPNRSDLVFASSFSRSAIT
jgi:cytochrome c oxidase subunit 3